jgi:hypothetical protein
MKGLERHNKIMNILISIIKYAYICSMYILFLNSLWYFIRVIIFDRGLRVPFVGIIHILEFSLLIISIIALYRHYFKSPKEIIITYLLRIIFIFFTFFAVGSTIYHTYFSPYVEWYWESGEWTF